MDWYGRGRFCGPSRAWRSATPDEHCGKKNPAGKTACDPGSATIHPKTTLSEVAPNEWSVERLLMTQHTWSRTAGSASAESSTTHTGVCTKFGASIVTRNKKTGTRKLQDRMAANMTMSSGSPPDTLHADVTKELNQPTCILTQRQEYREQFDSNGSNNNQADRKKADVLPVTMARMPIRLNPQKRQTSPRKVAVSETPRESQTVQISTSKVGMELYAELTSVESHAFESRQVESEDPTKLAL